MSAIVLVDVEPVYRKWARTEAHINAAVADRVFFATPQAYDKTPPNSWITCFLVTEPETSDDMGRQNPLIQNNCWGKTKALAAQAALAVQSAMRQLRLGPPVTVDQVTFWTGSGAQKRWLPDPVTNSPRYVVDVLLEVYGVAS